MVEFTSVLLIFFCVIFSRCFFAPGKYMGHGKDTKGYKALIPRFIQSNVGL